MHTCEEDFQHFLSYSGNTYAPPHIMERMRKAFEAAWEPAAQLRVQWTGLTPLAKKEVEEIVMRALMTVSV